MQNAEIQLVKVKGQIVAELRRAMKRGKVTQSELARRMNTSRAVVHRLLKDDDTSVTLSTMSRMAAALDSRLRVSVER